MKSKTERASLKRLTLVVVSIVLVLFFAHAILGKRGYFALRGAREQTDDLKSRIQQLESENKRLMEEIKALKTDPKMIEKIAREELGLVRRGEVRITSEPPAATSAESVTSTK